VTGDRIRHASSADIEPAARVIGEAFATLDASRWLVPDPARRVDVLTRVFEIHITDALSAGEVHLLLEDAPATPRGLFIGAVAVWFYRDHPVAPLADYHQRLQAAAGRYTDRFAYLDDLFDAHHPDRPHHYLAMLAVPATLQRQGRGTTLLRYHHERLHRIGRTASYLEAAGETNRDLYSRHGYHQHQAPFALPNGATFYPMWRPNPRQ
jgi:GNAT superfamily N-acetyltransferase